MSDNKKHKGKDQGQETLLKFFKAINISGDLTIAEIRTNPKKSCSKTLPFLIVRS